MAAKKKSLIPYNRAKPAPVVVISGPEAVLIRKAQDRIVAACQKAADLETSYLDAAGYEPGSLELVAGASLFSERKLVIVDGVAQMNDAFLADALDYVAEVNEDAVLVLKHAGGNRGSKLLTAIDKAGYPRVDAQALKSEGDKQAFAQQQFAAAKREISSGALAALMDALGADLSELNAGIEQLLADTEGPITEQTVDAYYGGRVEATGFKVADAAVAGRTAESLTLLRHALATGTDPVPLVAAIAMKVRNMARVEGISGSSQQLASELKMAPWQVDRARREMRSWNDVALGRVLIEVAEADYAVKGGGRDPVFALERLVTFICQQSRVR
ncbi:MULTISPECIES: DNA polymerase III subunit delta [Brevibacterium]|uniref:DNA-directed DNA polymerase n=1 Tax=Brevibacterium gallinarum TaxID=2762220 RepID=A0ABR8WT79_9MICO|nr:DNA polymerase III subunit delta [Brevibacterium gallinarum]MBD8020098.1 DNA polymerase III subunit delta [Brevibacterium gallinarum]MBU8577337.1 DNA polymerase III subunit delta [Brevibacterium luteolum]